MVRHRTRILGLGGLWRSLVQSCNFPRALFTTATICLGIVVLTVQNYYFWRQFTPFRDMCNQQKATLLVSQSLPRWPWVYPPEPCAINLTSLLHDSPLYLWRQQFCTLSSRIIASVPPALPYINMVSSFLSVLTTCIWMSSNFKHLKIYTAN